jgi:hypothetical protein
MNLIRYEFYTVDLNEVHELYVWGQYINFTNKYGKAFHSWDLKDRHKAKSMYNTILEEHFKDKVKDYTGLTGVTLKQESPTVVIKERTSDST